MADEQAEGYILEILSGLHRGVRQQIEAGTYSIGRSTECDIVLSDGSVKEQHAQIQLSEERCQMTPLDGTVFIDGQQINTSTEVAETHFQFQIGNVLLSVTLPEVQAEAAPLDKGKSWFQQWGSKWSGDKERSDRGEWSDDEPSMLGRIGQWILGLLLLALLIVPLFYLIGSALDGDRNLRDERALIQEILDYYDVKSTVVEPSDLGDSWVISGYQQDFAEYRDDIADRLDRESIDYELRMTDSDAVLQASRNVLAGLNVNLQAEAGIPGEVILIGFVEDQEQLHRVSRAIKEDVNGIREVNTDQIAVGTLALDHVQALLQDNELSEVLTAQRQRDVITVRGVVPANRQGGWEAVRSQFEFRYAPHMLMELSAQPKTERPVFVVQGVWTGSHPYVLMQDGQKYHLGTVLNGGWRIDAIRTNKVTLKRGEEQLELTF